MSKLYTIKACCDRLSALVEEGHTFDILDNIPFQEIPTKPTVYILNDGGHGGAEDIEYCPFCGTKIETIPKT